jgi:catechol 2,3-dioxygenase-like lactoylglutathione lyase family enzyme
MIKQVKETCLYVSNLEASLQFYTQKLGLDLISFVPERHVFFRAGTSVLLCFLPEVTRSEINLPPHYAYGPQHLAFEVSQSDYLVWKKKIGEANIPITHTQKWKGNLESFYFEDPDGHVLEIVPEGMWD